MALVVAVPVVITVTVVITTLGSLAVITTCVLHFQKRRAAGVSTLKHDNNSIINFVFSNNIIAIDSQF